MTPTLILSVKSVVWLGCFMNLAQAPTESRYFAFDRISYRAVRRGCLKNPSYLHANGSKGVRRFMESSVS